MKCKWPLNHISISTTGKIRPCCAWREQPNQPDFANTTIEDYTNSDFFKNLIATLQADQFASGCADCAEDERLGHHGLQYTGNLRYTQDSVFKPHDAEIKFGNLCNAGCIMCSGYNSSLIEKEDQKNPNLAKFRSDFSAAGIAWYLDESKLDDLAKMASSLNKIRFTGGEPTVRGLLSKFLKKIAQHNTDIKIQITTNGNSITNDLLDTVQLFRESEFNISVDGFGAANDFIRWPVKWQNINRSIDLIKKINNSYIVIETSLQVCTLSSLEDLIGWAHQRELEWNFNTVYSPAYLQPCVASEQLKEKVLAIPGLDLEKYLYFNSSKKDLEELREKCIKYLDTLDQVRGTNWRHIISI